MGTNGHVHTHPRAYSQVFRPYRPKRSRTVTYTDVQGRTQRFPGVQAQTGTNGHVHACPEAYSQVSRAHSPKLARTGTCILSKMSTASFSVIGRARTCTLVHKASFSKHTGPNQPKRTRAHLSRGVQPGSTGPQSQTVPNGHEQARAYSPK